MWTFTDHPGRILGWKISTWWMFCSLLLVWQFTLGADLHQNTQPQCECPRAHTWCGAGCRMLQGILCSFNVLLVLCLLLQCSCLGGKHGQPGQVRNNGWGGGCSSKLLCYLCKEEQEVEWLEQIQKKKKIKYGSLLQSQTSKKTWLRTQEFCEFSFL